MLDIYNLAITISLRWTVSICMATLTLRLLISWDFFGQLYLSSNRHIRFCTAKKAFSSHIQNIKLIILDIYRHHMAIRGVSYWWKKYRRLPNWCSFKCKTSFILNSYGRSAFGGCCNNSVTSRHPIDSFWLRRVGWFTERGVLVFAWSFILQLTIFSLWRSYFEQLREIWSMKIEGSLIQETMSN